MPSFNKLIPGDALKSDKPVSDVEFKKLVAEMNDRAEKRGGFVDLGSATVDALKRATTQEK